MGVRVASLLVIVSILGLSTGVGFYDWRAGLIVFSIAAGAVGIWHLTTQE